MGFLGFVVALLAVMVLILIPLVGVGLLDLTGLFGIGVPYVAAALFFCGLVWRVLHWGQSAVPFKIPTTAGQEKSLPWIQYNPLDNPPNKFWVVVRMALEVLCFRSLFRNTSLDYRGGRAYYSSAKWLWLFSLAFHYTFLVVIIRHLRFFLVPVPFWVTLLENVDGFMEVGLWPISWLPGLYISGVALLGAATYLFLRRVFIPQLRYISLLNDWFPLLLIIHIVATGILMRYVLKVDIVRVKELTMGLVTFSGANPDGIGVLFYIHLFLVSVLFAYFPFSKLLHAPGVFMSPTRNTANDTRAVRHINPWNPTVRMHHYHEYEDDFRELMIEAELPVDKEVSAEQTAENKE